MERRDRNNTGTGTDTRISSISRKQWWCDIIVVAQRLFRFGSSKYKNRKKKKNELCYPNLLGAHREGVQELMNPSRMFQFSSYLSSLSRSISIVCLCVYTESRRKKKFFHMSSLSSFLRETWDSSPSPSSSSSKCLQQWWTSFSTHKHTHTTVDWSVWISSSSDNREGWMKHVQLPSMRGGERERKRGRCKRDIEAGTTANAYFPNLK